MPTFIRVPRLLSAALAAAITLASCGSGSSSMDPSGQQGATSADSATATSTPTTSSARNKALLKARSVQDDCKKAFKPLLGGLHQIDSRLGIGLTFDKYGDRVGDAQVAYDEVDFESLDPKCTLAVGIALEDGLNQYLDAYNEWNECLDDYSCEVEGKVLRKIRHHWSEATERIDYADKTLSNTNKFRGSAFGD